VRLNLFWKLGFAFFALLIAVLLPVDFYAERALRRDYERSGFEQLAAIARIALAHPPQLVNCSYTASREFACIETWVAQMAASGVRVTVIASNGQVLADSQSDPSTMENHAGRPEIRDAFAKGDGQSIRHSVTIKSDLITPVAPRFAMPLPRAMASPFATASPSRVICFIMPFGCPLLARRPWSCVSLYLCKPWTRRSGNSAGAFGWRRSSCCSLLARRPC